MSVLRDNRVLAILCDEIRVSGFHLAARQRAQVLFHSRVPVRVVLKVGKPMLDCVSSFVRESFDVDREILCRQD
jgi:hypothetical protein